MDLADEMAADVLADPQAGGEPLAPESFAPPKPEPFDYSEEFWLSFPFMSQKFNEEVLRRHREGVDVFKNSAIGWTIWQAYRAYHNIDSGAGDAAPMTQLMAAGEMGELLAMAIPHYRSLVKHQIAMFTAERPSWDPIARTTDAAASRQVPMASALLDHVASSGILDKRLQEQVEMMMTAGSSFYVTGWDVNANLDGKGWFTERVFAPWELVHEKVRHYEDAKWWIFKTRESRWDWVAFFAKEDPEKAEAIAGYDQGVDGLVDSEYVDPRDSLYGNDSDRIDVWHLVAKPSLACPTGRYAMVLSEDISLVDGPYPFGSDVTIRRMCSSEFLGTSVPYCDSWGALAAAEAYNAILSMIVTRTDTCGIPNFYVGQGSEISYEDIATGNKVWEVAPGGEKPGVVDLLQIPAVMPQLLELLKNEMDATGGINSVTRGQPEENVSSGSMAALMQTMAMQFNSNLERAWILNLEGVGTDHVRVFQVMATDEQFISVCGDDNKWTSSAFKGEDLQDILRVAVKTTSSLANTKAGRAQIAEKMFDKDKIEPEEFMHVIRTGNLDRLFNGPSSKLDQIKAENEKLSKGEQVPVVLWEDHVLHAREHSVLFTTELRANFKLVQLVNEHLDQHYKMMQQMSQMDPDRLAMMGIPPLPRALQIGMQAQQMQSMAMGLPPPAPENHGPGPKQGVQPNTEETKAAPGPKPAPPGNEPSAAAPSDPKDPKPSKSPVTGQPVA